ncbi:MerR family transcriptional regulator [Micromonospora sp. WMMD712]|uniref:MerR family transcriptional regulator n=1 Tax=Micromonospora sp. WMMD712 TaxID=3016096 RepID=UPI00249AF6C0|nr:MerR family transcriptional regulator [Micromonospora sp. WMMD712]WFE60779.1 MerR family transcriptional regulator [Micromonospora sp. WMMD712]
MGLLTIGGFARAARLTPKALRLYDKLGLLRPAAVDPESGYRLYEPAQLERARLIASLRRIGMPLAEIGAVCGLRPEAAAEAVDAYWQRIAADTAERGRLATLLVGDLSGKGSVMDHHTLAVRHATRCEIGAARDSNEDAAYADERLWAVADGMRGPGGAAASTAAIDVLRALEPADVPAAELLALLAGGVDEAHRAVRGLAVEDPHQPVTTLTALLRSGSRVALVHVGDSRAYLLRDGELHGLTRDHTYVQSLVDAGRLAPEAAAAHPQRAVLVRAIGAGGEHVEADLALRDARPGDRYLLCSDGLSAMIDPAAVREALGGVGGPDEAVDRLVALAYAAGAPDNVACVVADVVAG